MPDYKNGKIYCIRSKLSDEVYIGSTCVPLSKRMTHHRAGCKAGRNCASAKLIALGDAYIELIEEYPCENKEQLNRREGEIMRAHTNRVNKRIAGRTDQEYHQDNSEMIAKRCRKWREANPEKVAEYAKANREKNRDKINEQRRARYAAHKAAAEVSEQIS